MVESAAGAHNESQVSFKCVAGVVCALQRLAMCCSVLQRVAEYYIFLGESAVDSPNVLQMYYRCVAGVLQMWCSEAQCVAARCSVLQLVAVCCSVLQCLQCVAVCCRVLQ